MEIARLDTAADVPAADCLRSQTPPAIVTAAGEGAQLRFLELFAASIAAVHPHDADR